MRYTISANVYIGDVSSQVYEFLYKKRPCIFLNNHKIEWRNNADYTMWHLGEVVNDIEELPKYISNCESSHELYKDRQNVIFKEKFQYDETPSYSRSAKIIRDFLDN